MSPNHPEFEENSLKPKEVDPCSQCYMARCKTDTQGDRHTDYLLNLGNQGAHKELRCEQTPGRGPQGCYRVLRKATGPGVVGGCPGREGSKGKTSLRLPLRPCVSGRVESGRHRVPEHRGLQRDQERSGCVGGVGASPVQPQLPERTSCPRSSEPSRIAHPRPIQALEPQLG